MARPRNRPLKVESDHEAQTAHAAWLRGQAEDLRQQLRNALLDGADTRAIRATMRDAQRELAGIEATLEGERQQVEGERAARHEQALAARAAEIAAECIRARAEMLASIAIPSAPVLRTDAR